ncbi:hypothetical protein PoB_002078300 [Plakobranchus ocellatus]|uniref:Uncharacterized protein n=1 Tax=Plakobranchus ocellatus TaxID=259542 RepID=A0AAV3ZHJ6_9GAST|nr:hypothetical protein PoB_002078300 [Plakobranchus ocellatus]
MASNNSNIAIGLLSLSVLLACASLYVVGSPGPLSGLKSTETCIDIFSYQETDCSQELDEDVFFKICVWVGFGCKCLGLFGVLVGKCLTEEDSDSICQTIWSILLTFLSVACYVVELIDIVAHLRGKGHWEYHGDVKITTSEIIAGLDLILDSISFILLVVRACCGTIEYPYSPSNQFTGEDNGDENCMGGGDDYDDPSLQHPTSLQAKIMGMRIVWEVVMIMMIPVYSTQPVYRRR